MKHLTLSFLLLCLFSMISCSKSKKETPAAFQLSNGLRVYLLKDKTLPYIQYDLLVPSGSAADPFGKEGLAFFTAEMLDRGSQKDSALTLTKKLENLGTQFISRVHKDYAVFSADALSWHYHSLLQIFSDIITQPAFSEKEIQWVKKQNLTKITKSPENTSSFAHQIFSQIMFQNKKYMHSPLGWKKTVQTITAQDAVRHYNTFFLPQHSILGVTGRYPKDIQEKLEKAFSKWKNTEQNSSRLSHSIQNSLQKTSQKKQPQSAGQGSQTQNLSQKPPQKNIQKTSSFKIQSGRISIIHQPGLFQSEIRIGKPFVSRTSPDYLPVQLANIVLGGGGLDSRLFTEVREKHGLTYHIQSQLMPLAEEGLLNILTPTRLNATRTAVERILKVIEHFYQKGITQDELLKAKRNYKMQLLKASEQASARLLRFIILKHLGLPYDLNHLTQNLKSVKLKEVQSIIQKYYSPHNIQIVILSDFNKVKDQFKDTPQVKVQNFTRFL